MFPAIDERLLSTFAFLTFLLCMFAWWKARDYQAISWAIVSLAVCVTYVWISAVEPPDLERHWIVRLDLFGAIFNIAYWRAHFILNDAIEKKRMVQHAAGK